MLDITTLLIYVLMFSLYLGAILCYFIFGGNNGSVTIKYDDYKNFEEESDEEMVDNRKYIKYHQLNSGDV